jgi:hypothetical protein
VHHGLGHPLQPNATPLASTGATVPATTGGSTTAESPPVGAAPPPLNQTPGFPSPIDEKAKRLADFFNGEVVELNETAGAEQGEAA